MRAAVLAIALSVVAVATIVACEEEERYVYTARRFDEANGCLRAYSPVERVVGEGADVKCAPTCFTFKDALYVSPVCPPLPVEATEVPEDDARCVAAVEAFETETFCDAPPDDDGGEDGGAGADATTEQDAAEES